MSVYYTAADATVPSQFVAFPKELFKDKYSGISLDAKLLYSVLLDRVSLSIKNNLIDVLGHAYIIFRQTDIMALFGCAKQKAQKLFKELESFSLIERKKQGNNLPDIIYVMNIGSDEAVDNCVDNSIETVNNFSAPKGTDEIQPHGGMKTIRRGGMKFSPIIYTNINQTKTSETKPSIYPDKLPKDSEPESASDELLMDRLTAENFVKSKIDYDAVAENQSDSDSQFVCSSILSVMTEIYSQKHGKIKINGYQLSYSSLRDKFMDINQTHVEYVLECVLNRDPAAEPVKNWRAYLATALYNAPSSIDYYYSNLVRFDKYKNTRKNTAVQHKFKSEGRDLNYLVV